MGFDRSGLLGRLQIDQASTVFCVDRKERNEEHSLAGCRSEWSIRGGGGAIPPLESKQVLVRIAASGSITRHEDPRSEGCPCATTASGSVGLDMAGTVEEVGPDVTGFKPGDEVYAWWECWRVAGTLAKFIVADSDLLALKPRSLSMRQAGAMPLVTITAWEGLVDRAHVRAGQTVLIHAGGAALDILQSRSPEQRGGSLCVCLREQKRIVRDLGATPIDYQSVSPDEYMEKYTGGRGFDIVYDTVGGATLDASFRVAKRYTGHVLSALGWGSHSLAPSRFAKHLIT